MLTTIFLLAQGVSPVQAPVDPLTQRSLTFLIPVGADHSKPVWDRALVDEALAIPLKSKRKKLTGGYTAYAEGADVVVLSSEIDQFVDLANAAKLGEEMPDFPKAPVHRVGDYGPALNETIVKAVDRSSPMNLRNGSPLPAETRFVLQPMHVVEVTFEGRTARIQLWNHDDADGSKERRKARYAELDRHSVPQTARDERKLNLSVLSMTKRDKASGSLGYQLLFARAGDPQRSREDAGDNAMRVYREHLKFLRAQAAERMSGFMKGMQSEHPGLYPPNIEGKSFADLPAAFQERLRNQILGHHIPGLDTAAAANAFLAGATVSKSTPGCLVGVTTAPDYHILGVPLWPR